MRVDLYGPVHKALRSTLFDLSVELARCDFSDAPARRIALETYRRTFGFLREHHQHEDSILLPLLAARAPDACATNRAEHEAMDKTLAELDAAVGEIERAKDADRAAAGRRLVALYDGFLADYLAHMRHEETVLQAAFWATCTDEELGALRGRIQGSIAPARFGEWLEIMLPAMNVDERSGMLRGMKLGAPEPAFRAAAEIASRVLGPSAWAVVRERAQLGEVNA
jgi:hypothetical protein